MSKATIIPALIYIESIDDELKPIVIKLRKTILGISKEITEKIKWSVPTYSINKDICAIIAHKKHVNLQIFQGANLEDANAMLGTGNNMRHLSYRSLDDVKTDLIKIVIQQAIVFDQ